MLLEFSVSNFRSFKDEATLSLIRPSFKRLNPADGQSWADVTYRVAGIYGANASGKSTILDAITALDEAVNGRRWRLHDPHLLDDDSRYAPTVYQVDFVSGERRYNYLVEAHPWGIGREELWEAGKRWKKLFIRTETEEQEETDVDAGASLKGATAEVRRITTKEDLFLAVARRYKHRTLSSIANTLASFLPIGHADDERNFRMQWLIKNIAEESEKWEEVSSAFAQAADFGITNVVLDERDMPDEEIEKLRRIVRVIEEESGEEFPIDRRQYVQRSLMFKHAGSQGSEYQLPLKQQSQGTYTWLTVIVPAYEALRRGLTFLVDELNASLHPMLVAELVEMFKNPDINTTGAQLVFTTHDVSLLDNHPVSTLDAGEVWIAEKTNEGQSSLYSLDDFTDLREGSNKLKRYLLGAFGGTPRVNLYRAISMLSGEEEH